MSPVLEVLDFGKARERKTRRAMIEHARETVALTQDADQALEFAVEAHKRAAICLVKEIHGTAVVVRDPEGGEEWCRLATDMLTFHLSVKRDGR